MNARGFTLLEMLVALSVLSLAALALIRLDAFAVRSASDLGGRSIARIVASNAAVDVLSAPAAPAIGTATATVTNGGRAWSVRTITRSTADSAIVRVDITATSGSDAAMLTLVRPAGGGA